MAAISLLGRISGQETLNHVFVIRQIIFFFLTFFFKIYQSFGVKRKLKQFLEIDVTQKWFYNREQLDKLIHTFF